MRTFRDGFNINPDTKEKIKSNKVAIGRTSKPVDLSYHSQQWVNINKTEITCLEGVLVDTAYFTMHTNVSKAFSALIKFS